MADALTLHPTSQTALPMSPNGQHHLICPRSTLLMLPLLFTSLIPRH
jgi:hypothetical protein